MDEKLRISDAEMEVLQVLWSNTNWMSINSICDQLERKGWNYKTVSTFLLRLQEKGVLDCKKQGRLNHYKALLTEDDYKRLETRQFFKAIHKGSMKSLLTALYDETADDALANELAEWLKKQ